jgi:bifunctional DNA-binding transcriptional regulator/antitoxin component of YhaV-PrlF toxin-antitoxin module
MLQKVIRVGNSYAVTIPRGFVDEIKLKAGQKVRVEEDVELETLTVQPLRVNLKHGGLTPEFLTWLKKFNAKYKDALLELAKK